MSPDIRPYGSWRSSVTPEEVALGATRISEIRVDEDRITWLESRPVASGRTVLVSTSPGQHPVDLLGDEVNIRGTVHEYGGGSYALHKDSIFWCNFDDQRIYRTDLGAGVATAAVALTPEPGTRHGLRYGDLRYDPARKSVWCVRESHGANVTNEIVMVPADAPGQISVAVSGSDFYAAPRVSPDGSHLAWISWNHPNMPWQSSEIWIGEIDESGRVVATKHLAGGPAESVLQPEWSPAGDLTFISDAGGWWNISVCRRDEVFSAAGTPLSALLAPRNSEFARPLWVLGATTYAFAHDSMVVAACHDTDGWSLRAVDVNSGKSDQLPVPHTSIDSVAANVSGAIAYVGSHPTMLPEAVLLEVAHDRRLHRGPIEVSRAGGALKHRIGANNISVARPFAFTTTAGMTARAFYYAPVNADFLAPPGDAPPLVTMAHGGPTSATVTDLRLEIQFWTTRGFAVVDVEYRGSSGYGRAYREELNGMWGIHDVDGCVAAARHLASEGMADRERMVIRGRSAGGFTVLSALTFHDAFAAGASYFGVADAELLAKETHKFESRYLDGLIAPYPENSQTYRDRSPINFVNRLDRPVIFFQGLDDEVVPPDQVETMVSAMKANGIPHACIMFEGESHGFRSAETIATALGAELSFYAQVLDIEIDNDLLGDPVTLWSP